MNNDTILYYDKHAQEYFNETFLINMNESYNKFLSYLNKDAYILDFGCGSGRDSKYFLNNGYRIKAIDGSSELCKLASEYINQKVINMKFNELNDIDCFDGIWACSSLLHITKNELLGVMKKLVVALKNNGILYMCFKTGNGEKVDSRGRFYTYYTKEEIDTIINLYPLQLIDFWNSKTLTNLNEKKYWNNFILKNIFK